MSDAQTIEPGAARPGWKSPEVAARIRRRNFGDRRLKLLGLGAIFTALFLLGILIVSLVIIGHQAFVQSKVTLDIAIDAKYVDSADPSKGNYRALVHDAFTGLFPDVTARGEQRELMTIITSNAPFILRDYVIDNPDTIGRTIRFDMPLSDPFDQLNKNVIPAEMDALSRTEQGWLKRLENRKVVTDAGGRAMLRLDVHLDPAKIDRAAPESGDYDAVVKDGISAFFPKVRDVGIFAIADSAAADIVKARVLAEPGAIGRTIAVDVPLAAPYATLHGGTVPKITNPRFKSGKLVGWFNELNSRGLIAMPFNWALLFNADSRFPELAGLAGALVGSFYALLVCFLISFPVGISSAIYLEEFAPKNRWTDLIEVNINNLAAVPSIVFGLLGLVLFLQTFQLPRSAPLVGGMTLALMTLPTIIIATRAALKAVPPSIREAALGVGASSHQVILHHVLPLAMPGIMTGTIIGLAQALGETAPLLLIGMNAFITSASGGIIDPATALPTQIFIWADSPERGFLARTSAAILVLLGFLVLMNAVAIYMRKRFERKW